MLRRSPAETGHFKGWIGRLAGGLRRIADRRRRARRNRIEVRTLLCAPDWLLDDIGLDRRLRPAKGPGRDDRRGTAEPARCP